MKVQMQRLEDCTLLQLFVSIDRGIGSAAPEPSPPLPLWNDPALLIQVSLGEPKVYHLQCAWTQMPVGSANDFCQLRREDEKSAQL